MNDLAPTTDFSNLISASLLRLRMKSPFFGTLAMFAQFIPTETIPTAATDGRDIFFNPQFLKSLPAHQQDGLMLHEVLHAALLHALRVGVRDAETWNIAADIAINGMIAKQSGLELPSDALRDEKLEHLSVEEIYEILSPAGANKHQLDNPDLLKANSNSASGMEHEKSSPDKQGQGQGEGQGQTEEGKQTQSQQSQPGQGGQQGGHDPLAIQKNEATAAHWRQALQKATVIARTAPSGKLPAGIERELEAVIAPQLDWKSHLWRYLVQSPNDFQGFDRRFISRGLYLEELQGDSVRVYVAVDTSRSIKQAEFKLLIEEVYGILGSYPHIECDLYYVDREARGPFPLETDSILPTPEGGGGTSFVPFFDRVAEDWGCQTQAVCIYLTDGYGEFPSPAPELPTLWIVTPGGLDVSEFPFGEAVKLIGSGNDSW